MLGFIKNLFNRGENIKKILVEGAIIIDVRTVAEYRGGNISDSKNIPLNKLSSKVEQIRKWNKPVVVCCASGIRSGIAVSILKKHGIDAFNGGGWASVNRIREA